MLAPNYDGRPQTNKNNQLQPVSGIQLVNYLHRSHCLIGIGRCSTECDDFVDDNCAKLASSKVWPDASRARERYSYT